MPVHHRRSGALSRPQRRKLVWATTNQSVTIASGAHTTIDLGASLEVAGASTLGVTIMRTHIQWAMSNWATVGDALIYGLIVVRDTDIGAGNGPNPNADPEVDWMLLTQITPVSSGAAVSAADRWTTDNRSKRKMEEMGQKYGLAITNTSAASKTLFVFARVLLALP